MTHRIAFLGSPHFAVPSLAALTADERFDLVLVVTQPDRPVGRGRKLAPPPVAEWAANAGLDVYQPDSMREDASVQRIRAAGPDLLVVVAYGEILNRTMLNLAPSGAINVHPSLLPRYRGSSPIPAAILNGDDLTGVSIMKLVRRLDAGPVLAQHVEQVLPEDTGESLSTRLAELAARMLPDVADAWISGAINAEDQDDRLATYTREWSKEDARIDWTKPGIQIERLVRAALPWPVAWTMLDDIRVQVREARVVDPAVSSTASPGTVVATRSSPVVATGEGFVELVTVQPAGKRAMPASDWFRNLTVEDPAFH